MTMAPQTRGLAKRFGGPIVVRGTAAPTVAVPFAESLTPATSETSKRNEYVPAVVGTHWSSARIPEHPGGSPVQV
jgi:hypothetical protein